MWWRLLIPAAMPLSRLHDMIQTAMGCQDYHLYSFTDGNRTYGLPDPEHEFTDERSVRFGDLDIDRGAIRYTYDFGDDWPIGRCRFMSTQVGPSSGVGGSLRCSCDAGIPYCFGHGTPKRGSLYSVRVVLRATGGAEW